MIKHNDMLAQMNTGHRFALTYVTLDKKRKTGGTLVTLENARKHQAGDVRQAQMPEAPVFTEEPQRSTAPNHSTHGTINIKCADGSLRKVHTRLIVKFNNHEVTL